MSDVKPPKPKPGFGVFKLTRKIALVAVIGASIAVWAVGWRGEEVIESAMLEQTKRQAHVFLLGMVEQFRAAGQPFDPRNVQSLIDRTMARDLAVYDFSIHEIYAFDGHGKVIGHSQAGEHERKVMTPAYLKLFESGQPILGDSVEEQIDERSGKPLRKTDIIVPLILDGEVVGAMEVEIDLLATTELIKQLDDQYESQLFYVGMTAVLMMLLSVGYVVRRWLLRPLEQLCTVAFSISRGDLSARSEICSHDEMGTLALAINDMAENIERLFTEQEEAHLQMLQSLAKALEAKDTYTAGHSGRVAKFSVLLGKRMGLPAEQIKLLKQGALMHDLGKIGIPEAILNKPAKLDEHEFELMKKHPEMTASIMRPLKRFKEFAEIAAWHHERWDGNGYPDGLKGENIPLLARIVGIADTWDAMTGDRVYRKGMSTERAVSIMREERYSGQWDPELLGLFIEMIEADYHAREDVARDMFPGKAAS